MLPTDWTPPFYLYHAGRETVRSPDYRNDCRQRIQPQRILMKRSLGGTGVVHAGGRRHLIPANHLMVVERPGDFLYCHEEPALPWSFEYISMAIVNPGATLLPPALQRQPVLDLYAHPELQRRITELVDLRLDPSYQPSLRHSALAYAAYLAYVDARLSAQAHADPQLDQIRHRLQTRLTLHLDLATLAAHCHCRPETLVRRFRAAYGQPPMRYRLLARLRHACHLLADPDLSIKEIAAACGFDSPDYFTRQFRRHLRQSPSAYRAAPDPLLPARLR